MRMFTGSASMHVCVCFSLCSLNATVVSYIILLQSYRNCLDSHLARVCHPFVIRTEGAMTARASGQQQNQLARNDICQNLPLERS